MSNKPLTSYFTGNRNVAFLSILLALVFWLVVKLSKEYRTSKEVAISWEIADTLSWATPPPTVIHVNYEGEGWGLLGRKTKNKILLSTKGLPIGETLLNRREILNRLERHFSSTAQIIDFTPDHFILNLDQNAKKKVLVVANIEPSIEGGLIQQEKVIIEPDSVWVAGPVNLLNEINTIYTTLWKPNFSKAQTLETTLPLEDESHTLSFDPEAVNLKLTVEQLTEKSFFVPIIPLNIKDSVRIFPDQIKISFAIPLSKFDKVKPEDFQLAVDFQTIKPGSKNNTLPIQVRKQPNSIINLHYTAKSIEFFIEKK